MANLTKTLRFEATRTMRLAQGSKPTQATMPCHVSLTLGASKPVDQRALHRFAHVCNALDAYLKTLNGRVIDAGLLPCKADAASLANFLAKQIVTPQLAGCKMRLERLHVLFGVIERAECTARKKAVLHYAWDDGHQPPPPSPAKNMFNKRY